jgi:tRNA G18 (ribose-2'-O)-methylase SpoU
MHVERIAEAADPRLEDYRDLRDGEVRRRRGVFVAEGRRVVRRLLAAGRYRARSVLVTDAALAALSDVDLEGIPVYLVGERTIRDVVGFDFHRGCLAAGECGAEAAVADLFAGGLLVVLERTTSPDNVGAIFRSALAFGADGVLLSPGCADPLYRKAIRVSMGATLRVPFAVAPEWPEALGAVRAAGFTLVGLTPDGAVGLDDLGTRRSLPTRAALIVGAEEDGLSAGARAALDVAVAIRMVPGDHSLNVAAACAIALHHFAPRGG